MNDDIIHICGNCAWQIKDLPLRAPKMFGTNYIAGYCRLCGTASVYVSKLTKKECEERNIIVPTLKELSKNPGNFDMVKFGRRELKP